MMLDPPHTSAPMLMRGNALVLKKGKKGQVIALQMSIGVQSYRNERDTQTFNAGRKGWGGDQRQNIDV